MVWGQAKELRSHALSTLILNLPQFKSCGFQTSSSNGTFLI